MCKFFNVNKSLFNFSKHFILLKIKKIKKSGKKQVFETILFFEFVKK